MLTLLFIDIKEEIVIQVTFHTVQLLLLNLAN